jgi:methylenetetrahydrofolate reductase (NADPH)
MVLERSIAKFEAFLKGMVFDCKSCGQCVLAKTELICPMTCPKGLRNGPCGGTTDEKCEVYPDKSCTWVRILKKRNLSNKYNSNNCIASPDPSLFHSSSLLNRLSNKDVAAKEFLPPLELPKDKKFLGLQTESLLELRLKTGKFIHTCEIRAPREATYKTVHRDIKYLKDEFDAVNATAYLNGTPSLPSTKVAAEIRRLGVESISQSTCRDLTKTSFIAELLENMMNGVNNQLCLTGDAYAGNPKIKQVFDMDSSLMLYEARYLRENGVINFTKQKLKKIPKPFLGAAINPFSKPDFVPLQRLKQKIATGADFIQTQLILDIETFKSFMEKVCIEKLDREIFILAGIPVIISKTAFNMLPKIPGVVLPQHIKERFEQCSDIKAEGIKFAKELLLSCKKIKGVSGVHLMLFGSDHSVLPEVIRKEEIKSSVKQNKEKTYVTS